MVKIEITRKDGDEAGKMYNKYKKKRIGKTENHKKLWITLVLMILVIFAGVAVYGMYQRIDITQKENNGNNVAKLSQTVEQVEEKSKELADVIEEVTNCVVGISKIKNNGSSIFLKDGVDKLGIGTGIIVSADGYILTNEHVSGGRYSTCYVTLDNGKSYNGTVTWSDSDLDLAIVKILAGGLPYAELGDSNNIRVGTTVYAIGNPIGFEFQRTVTSGIISGKNRTIKLEEENKTSYMADLIQTDATINPGNSGGPLITADGKVIGINTVKITSAEGIGFAVPINVVKPIIGKYSQNIEFEEATIGIFAYDKDVIPYLDSNITFENGIYVVEVTKNGPAEKAGLKESDIITKIDNIELNKMNDLKSYLYTKNPNDEVVLSVLRNKQTQEITVKLGRK